LKAPKEKKQKEGSNNINIMNNKYKCEKCGCIEFISQPNKYDVFISDKDKIKFQYSLTVDDKIILYCRECGEQLEFLEENVISI
jgi:predicted RNA-binding Zn-ribbon protein involved in translation (DUF1610 family)